MRAHGSRKLLPLLLLTWLAAPVQAQPARVILKGHLRQTVANGQAHPIQPLPLQRRLNFSLVLPLRNPDALRALLNGLYDPSSPNYHHFLTPVQFAESFGPSQQDYDAALAYARQRGFTVTATPADHLVIAVNATVAQVEQTFGVTMMEYQNPHGARTFFSPDREPSVPASVRIAHIAGLNNLLLPRPQVVQPAVTGARPLTLGSGPGGAYLSSDMRAAYYGGTALTGAGQTVGLVQFDGYNITDLIGTLGNRATVSTAGSNYVLQYTPNPGGPTYTIPINNVLLDGATGAAEQFQSSGDVEQVIDIAQAIGMAPALSQVRVYIGNNDADILSCIASENLAKEVSISWSWWPDDPLVDDVFFEEFAAQGQSVFVASGDSGAYSPQDPGYYPAEDPWVTAVGGTHLSTSTSGGGWAAETSWSRSGGGPSPDDLPIAGWQAGVAGGANGASAVYRNVPDVAMEADGDNYACNMGSCTQGWGGTSFAAPRWAGFMALINQQSTARGNPISGFLNVALYSNAEGSAYTSTFHDIVTGNNGYESGYSFNAGAGYDLVTGWGSPNGQSLIDALAPPVSNGFQLSVVPNVVALSPGDTATLPIQVRDLGSFSGPVQFSISGLPAGVSASFAPASDTAGSSLALTAGATVLGGAFFPQITGTSGNLTATASLSLTVNAPASRLVITSPAVPATPVLAAEFKPGTPITITGSALGAFQNLTIQWAEGLNPSTGWSSAGITLNASGSGSFSNAAFGSWDTSGITTADDYTIRLSATFSGAPWSATTVVYLEPDLLSSSWPQLPDGSPIWNSESVPISDTSGNTRLALATEDAQQTGHIDSFSPEGDSQQSLAVIADGTLDQPAAAVLTPGAGDSIVTQTASGLVVINPDGSIQQFHAPASLGQQYFLNGPPVVEDLDGDSLPELIAVSFGNGSAYVFAWRKNGQQVNSHFPIVVPDQDQYMDESPVSRLAIGDVDGDGKKELVVIEGTSAMVNTPRLFGADGLPRQWSAPTIFVPQQILLADLDHNGKLETVIFTMDCKLHVLQPDGTERPGWPRSFGCTFGGSLAAGDLNGDGQEEIVLSSGTLNIYNANGTIFAGPWPMKAPMDGSYGPVALADVNGDGLPEIITSLNRPSGPLGVISTHPAQLIALDRAGNVVRSWNLPGGAGESPSPYVYPVVGDFNNDGSTEIAVSYSLEDLNLPAVPHSVFTILQTGQPYHAAANDWPMLFRTPGNTSVLRRVAAATVSLAGPAGPPALGPPASYTITVAPSSSSQYVPSGVANLLEGSENIGSCTLVSGSCAISATLSAGIQTLVAGYVGDSHFAAALSAPLAETVDGNPTTTTLAISPAGGTLLTSAAYTLTATVKPLSGSAMPSGRVIFGIGSSSTAVALDASGVATCYGTAPSSAGQLTITAQYQGGGTLSPSTSGTLTENVVQPSAIPTVSGTSPAFIDAGGPAFHLVVQGTGFRSGSAILWGTTTLTTTYVSATELTAQVSSSLIADTSLVAISVENPDTATSGSVGFEVDSKNSSAYAPGFTSATASVTAGSAAAYPVILPPSAADVSLACLNLPPGGSCSYSATTGTVTVGTSSATPPGTYQVTTVFTESIPGSSSAFVLLPILLFPFAGLRKRHRARLLGFAMIAALAVTLMLAASGCGGGGGIPAPITQTQQVTASGVVTITIR